MDIKEKYRVISNRFYQTDITIEELAKEYNIEEYTVSLIVTNQLERLDEYIDAVYDLRVNKCGTCGSPVDSDGKPDNCTGECEWGISDSYILYDREEGDPEDLEF